MGCMDPRTPDETLIPAFRLPENGTVIYRRGTELLLDRDGELIPTPEPRYEVRTMLEKVYVSPRAYLMEGVEGAFAYDPRLVFRADDLTGALARAEELAESERLREIVHRPEDTIEVLDPGSVTLKVFADETPDVQVAWSRLQRAVVAFTSDSEGSEDAWQRLADARAVLAGHLGHAPAFIPQPTERPWLRTTRRPAPVA